MQKDDVFGNIEWTEDNWTASVSAPYFKGYGERLDLTEEDREALGPEGRFNVTIDTPGETRKRPTESQRAAWKKILGRKEAMWEEALDALVEEYQLQRPMRAAYWKVLRGERGLERSLPPVVDRELMRELIVPTRFGVHAPGRQNDVVDVYLSFVATWWSEGINIYIRDGLVREVTALGAMHNRKLADMDMQETPIFGTLRRRVGSKDAWIGSARIERFCEFGAIALDRSTWDESYGRVEEPMSDLPWRVACGTSSLRVYGKAGEPPTARQAAALEAFRSNEGAHAAAIIDAIFRHYQETFEARREGFVKRGNASPEPAASPPSKAEKGSASARLIGALFERLLDTSPGHKLSVGQRRSLLEKMIPTIKDAKQLRNITELSDLNIFSGDGNQPVALGFVFSGPWVGDAGLGVRWRDGKIEQIGSKEVAK